MRAGAILLVAALAMGCEPADVAGNYTVNLTNGENGCALTNWTVGEMTNAVPVVVVQDGDQVQLDVMGVGGTLLDLAVGSSLFTGQVGGNGITAALIGDNTARQGECVYTTTIDLDASVSGDFMEGQLRWRPVTNHHADCGVLESCENLQTFNGSRPPST
mgnify:CR=1 FL=1